MKSAILSCVVLMSLTNVFAQEDSLVVVSPRVGRFIDKHEREYFKLFPSLPDSERVYFVRRLVQGEEVITLTSVYGTQRPAKVDPEILRRYATAIEEREKSPGGKRQGTIAHVKLRSSGERTGEILFADIHGVVLADSGQSVIPYSEILSLETPDEFGKGVAFGMSVGALLGVAVYGGTSLTSGDELRSDFGVFGTALLAGAGAVAGVLVDLLASASGSYGMLLKEGEAWGSSAADQIRWASRFPGGTPELKLALGNSDKD